MKTATLFIEPFAQHTVVVLLMVVWDARSCNDYGDKNIAKVCLVLFQTMKEDDDDDIDSKLNELDG